MKLRYPACFAIACSALLGCSDDSEDCASTNSCSAFDASGGSGGSSATGGSGSGGKGGSGGSSAGGGSGGASGVGADGGSAGTTGCDTTLSPSEDRCVINNDVGVFVSPMGDDLNGDGTRDNPFATLALAIDRAKADSKKRVYACTDTTSSFNESITLDASHSGMEFYGGFSSCGLEWNYTELARAHITSPTPIAWRITGITSNLVIEGFDVKAADATTASFSSFAMIVANSEGVTLRRVTLTAGNGADGAAGVVEPWAPNSVMSLNAEPESSRATA